MKLLLDIPDAKVDAFLKENTGRSFEILEDNFSLIPESHKKLVFERLKDGKTPILWDEVKERLDAKWSISASQGLII